MEQGRSLCCQRIQHVRNIPHFIFCLPISICSFIVMASTTEYTRKIFNSPTYAEPCLVASAKQVLEPDNWCAKQIYSSDLSVHPHHLLLQGVPQWERPHRIPPNPQYSLYTQCIKVSFCAHHSPHPDCLNRILACTFR